MKRAVSTGTASSPRRTRRTHQTSARARRRRRGCHGAPARNTRPTPAPAHSTPGPAKAQTLCPRHHCRRRLLLRPRHRVRRIPRGETPTGTVAVEPAPPPPNPSAPLISAPCRAADCGCAERPRRGSIGVLPQAPPPPIVASTSEWAPSRALNATGASACRRLTCSRSPAPRQSTVRVSRLCSR